MGLPTVGGAGQVASIMLECVIHVLSFPELFVGLGMVSLCMPWHYRESCSGGGEWMGGMEKVVGMWWGRWWQGGGGKGRVGVSDS